MKMNISRENKLRSAVGIAWVAGILALIVSVMMVLNYFQLKAVDPLETPALQTLVDQLKNDPANEALKEDIRALDLMIRKAYFTSRWQLRTGGYILIFSVLVLIVSVRYRKSLTSDLEELEGIEKSAALDKEKARKWVLYAGSGLFALAFISGLLSDNILKNYGGEGSRESVAQGEETSVVNAQYASVNNDPDDAMTEISAGNADILVGTENIISEGPVTPETISENVSAERSANSAETATPVVVAPAVATWDQLKRNYPFFRGPEGIGVSYKNSVPTSFNVETGQNILWKAEVTLPGFNSPIVWGNKVFLSGATNSERRVFCYDASNGNLLWQVLVDNVPGSPTSPTEYTEDTGLAAPTMATNGNAVFAIFANGDVISLNMNGSRLWARNLGRPNNYYGHSSSLTMHKDKLIIQYDTNRGSRVMALSVVDGSTEWETEREVEISWASPVLVNTGARDELILTANPYVISYDPETGEENWSVDCMHGEVGPSVAYSDGIVYATNEYATFAAIRIGDNPEIIWEQNDYMPEASSPLAHNGLVIVATTYGVVACYDAQTGEQYWEMETDDAVYGSPVFANGNDYLMTNGGKLFVFKHSKEYQLVSESDLGENSICTPAFMEGKMFLRGYDNLYCIGN